jgi:hypothetical protein
VERESKPTEWESPDRSQPVAARGEEPLVEQAPATSVSEPLDGPAVRVPDGTQLAIATDGTEVTARFVVPEGRIAGLDIYMRAEGRRLRVRADEHEGATYMRSICERLRHRGYDAEVED